MNANESIEYRVRSLLNIYFFSDGYEVFLTPNNTAEKGGVKG